MKPQVTTGHIVELAWHKNVHLWAAMHYNVYPGLLLLQQASTENRDDINKMFMFLNL